ncbi:dihydrolipoamide acetyltransferase family protein [Picrophilus oshimae]|uniref:Dihydrolipoamide acetyltransferase component of pyruvate dehydrogenase complex n=1 Tax=Picrophilus torridus (strain ATCC 700027 / DSM 9790 / JCM 10055 / NBRC 100828 / KAW 2/3) TaxID=1122961 RepID=Q6L1M0_PICTO|nr:dihydrolipoamide acetyltransferase family protein [Picrophilus oshimae]AAT43132.1 dihydrolipoamide acetyltransferase component of pyruvate dehydrogenase complex [Picrophilus oshimae DSM 9789]
MYTLKVPPIGEGVSEGEIVKWNVKEGDTIEKDQEIVEIMTDKITIKIPSPVSGKVLKLIEPEGKTVKVGDSIATIDSQEGNEEINNENNAQESKEIKIENKNEGSNVKNVELVKATPAVRAYARQKGIDLSNVRPSRPDGRIRKEDIDSYISMKNKTVQENVEIQNDEVYKPSGIRKIIFDKMTKSKQIIPHFTITDFISTENIEKAIDYYSKKGYVSFTSFFAKACTIAFKEFPKMNALYNDDGTYTIKKRYNIGIAVDSPYGLTVVVVKDVDKKSIFEISMEIRELAEKARSNKLEMDDVRDSTFSVTNIGAIGGIYSTPIINYPEVAILAVNTRTNAFIDGSMRSGVYVTLACDHRLIDGAEAARFIKKIKEIIEQPMLYIGD